MNEASALEPVPAIYGGALHETQQLRKEYEERTLLLRARPRANVDPAEPSRAIYGVDGPFFLLAWRIPGANISLPAALMFVTLLVMSILLAFSLINVWIPNSPTLWMPIMIWIIAAVYFVFLAMSIFTLPSIESIFTESWSRSAKYHRNDVFHFWWGFMLYFFVSVFYMIWYTQSAGQTLPVDPLLDIVVFLGQQNLHLVLLIGSLSILFTQPFANNIMLTGTLLYRINPLYSVPVPVPAPRSEMRAVEMRQWPDNNVQTQQQTAPRRGRGQPLLGK